MERLLNKFKTAFIGLIMKGKITILIFLVIPLILGGCFNKANYQTEEPLIYDTVFTKEIPQKGGYKVKYPVKWQLSESSSGKIKDFQDVVVFIVSTDEEITISIFDEKEKVEILNSFAIESESQTQIDGLLASNYLIQEQGTEGKRSQIIAAVYGDYLYLLKDNNPGSENFVAFVNNFSFLSIPEAPQQQPVKTLSDKAKIRLYFDDLNKENSDCLPDTYQEVIVQRPDVEIGLIPLAIKSLIQVSNSKELADQNLSSAIPVYTRLLSFGYENNTAIVNFNDELNKGGGSCAMAIRRGQIEKTLKALNEISNLLIKKVEIQINGQTELVLQP